MHRVFAAALVTVALARVASAQDEIRLWPNGAPGSEGKSGPETLVERPDGVRRVASIHHPSITAHLPAKGTATGAAVIVLPGGGHQYLSIENEGTSVAQWLSEHGIAAFVLKYRLAWQEGSTYTVEQHAVGDALRAIRLVRSRAKEWNVDPERVGVMGFSAGGQLAYYASQRFDAGSADAADAVEKISSRPAFQALIYAGSIFPGPIKPPPEPRADTPPAFMCVALDDKGSGRPSVDLFQKLRDAGASVELHVYATGGHGFGMRDRPLPVTSWPARFREWLGDRGFLTPAASSREVEGIVTEAPLTAAR